MLKIISEGRFYDSVWCKNILSGLTNQLKKKRRTYYEQVEGQGEITIRQGDDVFLVGTNDVWIRERVKHCNEFDVVPYVICNQYGRSFSGKYHIISSDIQYFMEQMCIYLSENGLDKAAFCGVNMNSASDKSKAEFFIKNFGQNVTVIENTGDNDSDFEALLCNIDKYKAVVCANDFVAILLVKKILSTDKSILDRVKIVSCVNSLISAVYGEYITSFEVDFCSLGTAAAQLYEFAAGKDKLSGITLYVKTNEELAKNKRYVNDGENKCSVEDAFYKDEKIINMLKIENLLSVCDGTDITIIKLLCEEKTYIEIAEKCFMSESNVKYRVKKYIDVLEVQGKDELCSFLSGYLV